MRMSSQNGMDGWVDGWVEGSLNVISIAPVELIRMILLITLQCRRVVALVKSRRTEDVR